MANLIRELYSKILCWDESIGGGLKIRTLTEDVAVTATADTATTIAFPANSIGLGASTKVLEAFHADATNFDLGITGATTRYLTNSADTLNAVATGVSIDVYAEEKTLLITYDASPTDVGGSLRVAIYFIEMIDLV
jgi:hypothetical protein